MSPVWNPAFDLGIGILLLYLWVKRRQRPYWQGFLGLPLMLALLTSLSAWVTLTSQISRPRGVRR